MNVIPKLAPIPKRTLNIFKNSPCNRDGIYRGATLLGGFTKPYLNYEYIVTHDEPVDSSCPIKSSHFFNKIVDVGQADLNIYFGGNHDMSASSVGAFLEMNKDENPGIICIDNTNHFESNDILNIPMAYLLDIKSEPWMKFPKLDGKNIVYLGTWSSHELIRRLNIKTFRSNTIHECGAKTIMYHAFEHLKDCNRIHVSFNVNVMDPITGTDSKAPGGLSYVQALNIARSIKVRDDKVNSIDFVGFNPDLCIGNYQDELEIISDIVLTSTTKFDGLEPFIIK
jgi:arginase family enzyme